MSQGEQTISTAASRPEAVPQIPPRPGNIPPSLHINPVTQTVTDLFPVVLTGTADPGTSWYWSPEDKAWEPRPIVAYTGVQVMLDTGQKVAATSADPQWDAWSATVQFPSQGAHSVTAVGFTTRQGEVSSAPLPVLVGDTLWHTIRYLASGASPAHWQAAFDPVVWPSGSDNSPLTAVCCAGVGDQLQLVGIGGDGRLWYNLLNGSWAPDAGCIETQEQNDPGAFVAVGCGGVDGELQVVGVDDASRQLWHTIRHADGTWQPSFGLIEDNESNDPGQFGVVSCAGVGGDLHVVGIAGGQMSQMWHTIRYSASGDSPAYWQAAFDPVVWPPEAGPFAAVSCAAVGGQLHLVGLDGRGQLWHNVSVPGADPPWAPDTEPIETQIQSNPGPFYAVGCGGANGELHVVGVTGQLWHTIRHADGTWQPFFGLIEDNESNDPGAFAAVGCAGVGDNLHVAAGLLLLQ
jgi:hypothetical protein